ncbi:MAG TPA: serine/threonine-protein kinase, partial [Planctomycetota bacterium]|nr:serine/threonine-protein kinase [Planctomycetota bacterium]
MSSADYRAVAEHFDRLLDMDLDERRVYLADLRRSAPHLALAVERLLEHDSEPEGPLERMVLDDSATVASASASAPHDDDPIRIGKYSVVRRLGRGGMGVVFECEQEQPRRRVAIKVLHAALTTPGLRRRFVREAELLARVQHDGIAHVYEAGDADIVYADTSTTRQPFLAMEFVDGMELVDHAMHHGLDLKARLRLIASVCDAVEAAHRSGVVHRDLKPSNILVTADGKPKVLDFGIARESANHEATLVTEPGQILGTLAYMSPEQILGHSDEVGPRSDVYALGVIGYELLAGVLPKDVRRLSIVEAARVVTKEDATRLGLRSPALAGDIETVIEKAL